MRTACLNHVCGRERIGRCAAWLLFWVVSALLLACALSPPPPAAEIQMPRLQYRERTLANGLRVLALEDHSTPTVAIQVWYHVGSKDDPEGRSGFAHLFEHMMFKSTRNMPPEMLDRLTEDVGGYNNAFTAEDVTVYHEVVPSNYLETLLWAEAERLASLNVDLANFQSEREVVKEEFRQSYVAPPYGKLSLLVDQKSFTRHPYRRPGIGNIDELDAALLPEVQAFHATYYRPDNATLVVAGDFDAGQLDGWVDQYFSPIPRPDRPLPRVTVQEPERTREARTTEYAPNVPLPALVATYLVPPAASGDAYALRIADTILSSGASSRLYRALVYEQQVATMAACNADLREDISLFTFRVVLAGGKKMEVAEQALLAEIRRLQAEPVTPAELEKTKNQIITRRLREHETSAGKANILGYSAVVLGDPGRANSDLDRLRQVTAADVQRVMQKYFTEANRVVIHYLAQSENRQANEPQEVKSGK